MDDDRHMPTFGELQGNYGDMRRGENMDENEEIEETEETEETTENVEIQPDRPAPRSRRAKAQAR